MAWTEQGVEENKVLFDSKWRKKDNEHIEICVQIEPDDWLKQAGEWGICGEDIEKAKRIELTGGDLIIDQPGILRYIAVGIPKNC